MSRFILFISVLMFIFACGGGGGSVATGSNTGSSSSSTPAGISGLSGSISDIEIIDVD